MQRTVAEYYDKISGIYEEATASALSWTAPGRALSLVAENFSCKDEVLDLGAGTGQTVDLFVSRGCKVTAVDISSKMLGHLKAKFPEVESHVADLDNGLGFLTGRCFDIVMAVGVLEFVSDIEFVLRQARTVMKESSRLCITTEALVPNHPIQSSDKSYYNMETLVGAETSNFIVRRFTDHEIERLLTCIGFRIKSSSIGLGYYKTEALHPIYYRYTLATVI